MHEQEIGEKLGTEPWTQKLRGFLPCLDAFIFLHVDLTSSFSILLPGAGCLDSNIQLLSVFHGTFLQPGIPYPHFLIYADCRPCPLSSWFDPVTPQRLGSCRALSYCQRRCLLTNHGSPPAVLRSPPRGQHLHRPFFSIVFVTSNVTCCDMSSIVVSVI